MSGEKGEGRWEKEEVRSEKKEGNAVSENGEM